MSAPWLDDGDVVVHAGDCREVMRGYPGAYFDAIVSDPPYELGFMGRAWDSSGVAYQPELWAEALRVLKPGGHLLAFGGTRTYHRMACAIEDAGFQVRDCLSWLYGSGFPKSLDVSKAIDRAAGAEREVVGPSARHVSGKPEQRTAGLNGSATFAETIGMGSVITAPATPEAAEWAGWGTALKPAWEPIVVARKPLEGTVAANVLAHGTGALNIDACRVGMSDADREAIEKARWVGRNLERAAYGDYGTDGTDQPMQAHPAGRWPANVALDEQAAAVLDAEVGATAPGVREGYGDTGGPSRFFYTAKASRAERGATNRHPTVKPVAVMRWLIRLVTPPGGLILDPFAGSGTTGVAARAEGVRCHLIELDPESLATITDRLAQLSLLAPEAGE